MYRIIVILTMCIVAISCKQTKNTPPNKSVATQYYQILDSGEADKLDNILSNALIDHDGHSTNPVEEIKELTNSLGSGFSQLNHKIEILELIGQDSVFVRWRMTGKHIGPFFGVPASSKNVDFVGHDLLLIKEGKIVEIWHVENLLGLMEQITIP